MAGEGHPCLALLALRTPLLWLPCRRRWWRVPALARVRAGRLARRRGGKERGQSRVRHCPAVCTAHVFFFPLPISARRQAAICDATRVDSVAIRLTAARVDIDFQSW